MSKDLSIILPVYNVEKYLDKCLDSLVNQTINNYEIIVVNDGTKDKSQEIIDKYVNKYPNIIRSFIKENGGLSDARNYGIERCKSKYISFVDGDDFLSDDYVETSLNKMEVDDLDILIFSYNQYYLSDNTKEKIDLRINGGIYNLKNNKEILAYTPNAAWNKIYKTSLFIDNNIRYPYGYRHQDLGTTPKLLLKANKIGYLNKPLYNYIIDRPNNITTQIDKKLYHIIDMAKEVMDYYKLEDEYDKYIEEFEYLIKRNFIQSLRKAMKLSDKKFVFKFIDDIFKTIDVYFKNSKHKYKIDEEDGDRVYLNKFKCKLYYVLKGGK